MDCRICDQARAIKKNGWLSVLELIAIRRDIEMKDNFVNDVEVRGETGHHETNSTVDVAYMQRSEVIEEEVINNDAIVKQETCKGMDLTAVEGDEGDEGEVGQFMDRGERCDGIACKRVERRQLKMTTKRANGVIKYIDTKDITETSSLIVATSVSIAKELGLEKHIKRVTKQERWWKRRIKDSISELRSHIDIFQNSKGGNAKF